MRSDNLTIQQGTTTGFRWPITSETGAPVDVTDWTVRAQVRAYVSSDAVLHEWSTAAGNAVADSLGVTLTVAPGESESWPWTRGVYNVLLTDPDGNVFEIAQGTVSVDPSITRG